MFIDLLMLFIDFTGNIHNDDMEKLQEKYEEACYDRLVVSEEWDNPLKMYYLEISMIHTMSNSD